MGRHTRTSASHVRVWMLIDPRKQGSKAIINVCTDFEKVMQSWENKRDGILQLWTLDAKKMSFELFQLEGPPEQKSRGHAKVY